MLNMLELAEIAVTYRRLLPEPCGQLIGFAATLALLFCYRRTMGKAAVTAILTISVLMTAWHIWLCADKTNGIKIKYFIELIQAAIFLCLWLKYQKKPEKNKHKNKAIARK